MAYYMSLFSPETYQTFATSNRNLSCYAKTQHKRAQQVHRGDVFIQYLIRVSRFVGYARVLGDCCIDETPFYYEQDDPYVVRFPIESVVWLDRDNTIPIRAPRLWNALSFTRDLPPGSLSWTGKVRASLTMLTDADGEALVRILAEQARDPVPAPIPEKDWQRLLRHRVRTPQGTVTTSVPVKDDETLADTSIRPPREHATIQTALAHIGTRMRMKIWVPPRDRGAVRDLWPGHSPPALLEHLPLNYDDTTLKTIQEIDVLWIQGRSITRAFEVEHTTSVYSGILRMADLLALQPNMDIRLHIVADNERREKVFEQLTRPVFSLLERGPLYQLCTFIPYESVQTIAGLKHLAFMNDSVLDEYAETAE